MADRLNGEVPKRLKIEEITSHREVYQIYKDLIENPGRGRQETDKPTYYKPPQSYRYENGREDFPIDHAFRRKTSFTEKQEIYNDLLRVTLRNEIADPDSGLVGGFKKRWDKDPNPAKFENHLVEAYMESLKKAFDKNPNLTPAFYAFLISSGAGSEGLMIALREGVFPRLTGRKDRDQYMAFVGMHLTEKEKPQKLEYEVQCAAPALTLKIIKEVETCLQHTGRTMRDLEMGTFDGPWMNISSGVKKILKEKMKDLGYTNLKES